MTSAVKFEQSQQNMSANWSKIDPFSSKNQNFDPKHKIPKNQKLSRFHYYQIWLINLLQFLKRSFNKSLILLLWFRGIPDI